MKTRTRGRRVAAGFLAVLAAVCVAAVVFLNPFSFSEQNSDDEVSDIQGFDVAMNLDSDGTLMAQENIAVNFPIERRGIFRIFDTEDPQQPSITHPVNDLQVQRDGQSEYWTWVDSASGTETARIGLVDRYLPVGVYNYGLSYSTTDVVNPDPQDDSQSLWWWDVVGSGWSMPIAEARVVAELPAEPVLVECVRGVAEECDVELTGTTVTVNESNLEPFEAVTLRVTFDASDVPPNEIPTDLTWLWSILAGILGAGLAWLGVRSTKEAEPGFPVLFEPPAVKPAVGAKVLDEKSSPEALQATLFDLGTRGIVTIEPSDDVWAVHRTTPGEQMDHWEDSFLNRLGLSSVGQTFVVEKSVASGKMIASAEKALSAGVNADTRPYLKRSAGGMVLFAATWTCLIALVVLAGLYLFGDVDVPIPLVVGLGAFTAVGAVVATDLGRTTKRTPAGRELWSRTGGFARFLGTDSSESRFDAAARLDWFPTYLPWAVALGISSEWAQRYAAQGIEAPAVPYVVGWGYGAYHYGSYQDFSNSFNSAISSASAAYAASQASSGGGGGGFSGGSGGGGGGGGSW